MPGVNEWDLFDEFLLSNSLDQLDQKEILKINYPGYCTDFYSPTIIDYGITCRMVINYPWIIAFDKDKPDYYYVKPPLPWEYGDPLEDGYYSVRCIKE